MTSARPIPDAAPDPAFRIPSWAMVEKARTPEDLAFSSGAALAHLDVALRAPGVPLALLRARLALRAATVCVGLTGRSDGAGALRDAVHLRPPGNPPGPAGEICLHWQKAVARPNSIEALHAVLPARDRADIARWRAAGQGAPIARAAAVLEAVLAEMPRAEAGALILAEAALAQALGWARITPVLAPGLRPRDLRRTGDDLRLACHRAIIGGAGEALRLTSDLSRRAECLRAAAPKLRARGAGAAVEMILTLDAVTPGALGALRSGRAARRFCDRLVALGVLRELTGRETFRLYGL